MQVLSIMARRREKLSALASVMRRYPQVMINVPATPEDKIAFYTDPRIQEATERARRTLGDRGRIVVRVSGTEPVIRVMVEGVDVDEVRRLCEETAAVVRESLK